MSSEDDERQMAAAVEQLNDMVATFRKALEAGLDEHELIAAGWTIAVQSHWPREELAALATLAVARLAAVGQLHEITGG